MSRISRVAPALRSVALMTLDRATRILLERIRATGQPPLHEMDVREARLATSAMEKMYGSGPDMSRAVTRLIPRDGAPLRVRILLPRPEVSGLILYFHGGGWTLGDIDEYDTLGRELANRTGCAVVLVDYRLAPEDPFPAAVEDAWDALRWADANVADLAGAAVPLIVAGDSAGGNLAAVVAQRAHANGLRISLQVLIYPVIDCNFDTASYLDDANQLMVSRDTMIKFWDYYAPGELRRNPEAAPGRAKLSGELPPAVILTAEHDVLRDEGLAYVDMLRSVGVSVRHRHFSDQMHGFFTLVNVLPGSAQGIDYFTTEVARHLNESADHRS